MRKSFHGDRRVGTLQPLCRGQVSVDRLRCEYRKDPLGIDATKPRLSWILLSDERGQKQTAYQVLAAATPEALAKDQGDLWDSGQVASDQSIQLEYAGKPLTSRMQCHWKVRVWDKDHRLSPWSKPATWTMGLLEPKDWQAQWIGAVVDRPERTKQQRIGLGAAESRRSALCGRAPAKRNCPIEAAGTSHGLRLWVRVLRDVDQRNESRRS